MAKKLTTKKAKAVKASKAKPAAPTKKKTAKPLAKKVTKTVSKKTKSTLLAPKTKPAIKKKAPATKETKKTVVSKIKQAAKVQVKKPTKVIAKKEVKIASKSNGKKILASTVKKVIAKPSATFKPKSNGQPLLATKKVGLQKSASKAVVNGPTIASLKTPIVNKNISQETKPNNGNHVKSPTLSQVSKIQTTPAINKTIKTTTDMANQEKTRYSDAELAEFKELILQKLEEKKRDLDMLKGTIDRTDDHGTDDTAHTFKPMEDGSDVMTKEEVAQLATRQKKIIQHLENALFRIENKTYGICRVTGKLIPKERLRSVPHATTTVEAKMSEAPQE